MIAIVLIFTLVLSYCVYEIFEKKVVEGHWDFPPLISYKTGCT